MCFVLPQKSYINYYHCNFLWLLQQQLESWFLFSTSYCLVVWLCCENFQLQKFDSLVSKTKFSLLVFHVFYYINWQFVSFQIKKRLLIENRSMIDWNIYKLHVWYSIFTSKYCLYTYQRNHTSCFYMTYWHATQEKVFDWQLIKFLKLLFCMRYEHSISSFNSDSRENESFWNTLEC